MPIKTLQLNRFDLGMNDEERDLANGYFRYLENVDLKIRGAKQVQNTAITTNDKNITGLLKVETTIWGLGHNYTASGLVALWNLTTGAVAVVPATGYNFNPKFNPFLVWDGTYIYFDNLNHIGKYIPGGGMIGDWSAITGGLHGGIIWKGEKYGWGDDNKIYKVVATAPEEMIQIPINQTIVELIDLGDLMGIICTAGTTEKSQMYIWDGIATTSFYDIKKIGNGYVKGGGMIDGIAHIILQRLGYKEGIEIKRFDGNFFHTVYSYEGRENNSSPSKYQTANVIKVREYNNYLYILMAATRPDSNEVCETVIAKYGRKSINDNFSFSIVKDLVYTNNGTLSYSDFIIYYGYLVYNPILATLYSEDDVMDLATTGTLYAAQPGVIETSIYTLGNSRINKKWIGFSTQCSPLPADASITVKYKVNEDADWTTAAALETENMISKETLNIESTGAGLPDFKEIQFRFELLGGAEITGFTLKFEEQNNLI